MTRPTAIEDKIIELETRIAFQDKTIADLDEVVRDFTRRVETLERQLREVREAAGAETVEVLDAVDEPPPHY